MTSEILKKRTKNLGVNIYKICKSLPKGLDQNVIGFQLLKASTSVGANYRAACRARSKKEFVAKLSICIEECDEVMFWLEFLNEVKGTNGLAYQELIDEANELLSIFIKSRITATKNLNENQ